MNGRRDFLKGAPIVSGATLMGTAVPVQAVGTFPVGLIYTKEAPGRWPARKAHMRRG